MDKTLDLDELERVAREVADGANALLAMCNVPLRVCAGDDVPFATAKRILTLIAAARPAVVSDEVVPAVFDEFNRQFMNHVEAMRAALALLPGGVPDGYMLVPREPTEAMIRSGQGAADDKYWLWRGLGERPVGSGLDGMALYVDAAYRAMLSASPKEVSHER